MSNLNPILPYRSIELSHEFFFDANAYMQSEVINIIQKFKQEVSDFNLIFFLIREKMMNSILIESVIPKLFSELKNQNINHFSLILPTCQYHEDTFKNLENLEFIDYWAIKTYVSAYTTQPTNQTWNTSAYKGLFLTGKPKKINRAGLLFEYWKDKELFNDLETSFFYNPKIYKEIKDYLITQPTEQEYQQFIFECKKSPDNTIWIPDDPNHWGNPEGFLFDVNLFSSTGFSIISETDFTKDVSDADYACKYLPEPIVFITEKTWKGIINHHPFLMAGTCDIVNKLQSLGFRTFNEYFDIPDYHLIEDNNQRLLSIVHNTKKFIQFLKKSDDNIKFKIQEDTNYNFQHYENYVNDGYKKLYKLLGKEDKNLVNKLFFIPYHA